MKSSNLLIRVAPPLALATAAGVTAMGLLIAAITCDLRAPIRFALVVGAVGASTTAAMQREEMLDRYESWRGWRSAHAPYWISYHMANHQGQATLARMVYSDVQPGFVGPIKPAIVVDYGSTAPAIAPAVEATQPIDWLDEFEGYPSVLIHGAPGSGKSTAAEALICRRQAAGHEITIVDVHRKFGQWPGLSVVGDGMDYDAANQAFVDFLAEVRQRYATRATEESYNPPPATILVEEFTSMAGYCPNAAEFFTVSVSDIRKVNLHVLYVSHARTMTGLGGSKGLAATRDASLLELELFAQTDKTTKKAAPTGRGRIRYPGGKTVDISLPKPQNHSFPRFPEAEAEAEAIGNRFSGEDDRDLYRRFIEGGYRSQKAAIADLFGVFGGRRYGEAAARLEALKEQSDREGWP